MSCIVRDNYLLCPSEDCDKESCPWGASLKSLLSSSKLPAAQWGARPLKPDAIDLEAYHQLADVGTNIREWVKPSSGEYKNIIICSNITGNGKTSWAIKLLQKYFVKIAAESYLDPEQGIIHGCFVPITQFIYDAKDFNGPYRDRYAKLAEAADRADFTIYDDIGAAEYSTYDYTTLLVSIERRVFAEKFCVFTTNLTGKEKLTKKVGKRLADRIWDTSEIIEFKGKGVRC